MNIAIISSSVRPGRKSHRMALYFKNYLIRNKLAKVEMLDLNEYKFPIFEDRLSNMKDPPARVIQFSEKVSAADGIIIVTPEYNGGYPASLKNAIDVLYKEWKRKPVALATASSGQFGGAQVVTSLVFSLWKIGVCLVPALYAEPMVQNAYTQDGTPINKEDIEKRTEIFMQELLWYIRELEVPA